MLELWKTLIALYGRPPDLHIEWKKREFIHHAYHDGIITSYELNALSNWAESKEAKEII